MWLQCFAARARTKTLKDNTEKEGESEITDPFLATAGWKAIMEVSTMANPTNLKNHTFGKISQIIRINMRPKKNMYTVYKMRIDIANLKKLEQEGQMIEEDLIQLRLIEAMHNASHRYKILEQLQIGNMSLNSCID